DVLAKVAETYHGQVGFVLHGLTGPAVWFALAGFVMAWYFYMKEPAAAEKMKQKIMPIYNLLMNKYWFDNVYQKVFGEGSVSLGKGLWKIGDMGLIDGLVVNGSAKLVKLGSSFARRIQTGYLYHYAFAMIVGLIYLLTEFVLF
ncbi:MAG: NADH-quinone oxidoreductase subunit L, partial [Gammaproteobacteria bacterium]|nr:NADH-quinone oxidoreductase subunit L [Gammaproteobacteria bacterium]